MIYKEFLTIKLKSIMKSEFNRRKFIKYSSSLAMGTPSLFAITDKKYNSSKDNLTCQDIANHLQGKGNWVDWDKTVDTFKAGDPSRLVKKVAVAWKPSFDALSEAYSRGADMFISHESIFVRGNGASKEVTIPTEKPKYDWLTKTGMVVYRCHDLWDRFPKLGVRDTWQKELNIGDKIIVDEYPFYVTEVAPISVREIARHILKQIQPLGQNGVVACGNLEKKVTRIGTGTGAIVDPFKLFSLGAEVGVISDDYYVHVRMGVHANELNFPVILVNHGVSEEWAIKNLACYLQEIFPSIDIFHIPQYCPYEIIT